MDGKFYLGRVCDPQTRQKTAQPLLYDPADLTTHAVVVGMTGSGKTGLCIDLLEEAALSGIPALMVDPKGDITNSLLHFPGLSPQDFLPWVNPDQARREGKTVEGAAVEAAQTWQKGLAEWGLDAERLQALKNAAQFCVYTPGSDVGIPVSILASLKSPAIPWQENRELLREKISGTVTALLGLVGLEDIDPIRSREHILLANIFENAWSKGIDLTLGELILQTQTPPFAKLGVFDVDTFFPETERFELAMLLNNILAAPAFQSWIEGQPLELPSLLYAPDGRPRHSVFYIAHLSDAERMFFVTLLFSAVESWMRSQVGSAALRAIVYFDEIYGYLPPTSNPSSKQPMLRMLKQARAFGVGLVLVTQNPVDVDYKALSNAGSWFIGKLQTDQDKQRLLDGLEDAMPGGLERSEYDRLISTLGQRTFLLHNVHEKHPRLFQTRWALNYLAGPLTRAQIPALNRLAGVEAQLGTAPSPLPPLDLAGAVPAAREPAPWVAATTYLPIPPDSQPDLSGSSTRPTIPSGVAEYFLPNNLTFTQAFKATGQPFPEEAFNLGLVYRPVVLAQASIRYLSRQYDLDHLDYKTVIVSSADRRGMVRWEDHLVSPLDPRDLEAKPDPQARFLPLEAPFTETRTMGAMQKEFLGWAYRTAQVTVRVHEGLGLSAGPEVSPAQFRTLCTNAARQKRDEEVEKVVRDYDRKVTALQEKLAREQRELDQDETELSQRKLEELGTNAELFFSLFGKRNRPLSTSLTKRRLTGQAKADVVESKQAIKDVNRQIEALEVEKERVLAEINERWGRLVNEVKELHVTPYKKDVLLDLFGVAWMPCYVVQEGSATRELPGFTASEISMT